MNDNLGTVNADTVLDTGIDCLQSFGMTFKKAEYITDSALLYAAAECVSYGDLAILRGMRMVYHHRNIDRRRLSPYCSVASLYFWAVAGGCQYAYNLFVEISKKM